MAGLLDGEWFEPALSGPLPHQVGWKERMARIAAQALQPVPEGTWDDPRVRARAAEWVNNIGPGGAFTKIFPGAMKEWRKLISAGKAPDYAWDKVRHNPAFTNYDPRGAERGYRMYRSQKDFDKGAALASEFAQEAHRMGKPAYARGLLDWLSAKAAKNNFSLMDDVIKMFGP